MTPSLSTQQKLQDNSMASVRSMPPLWRTCVFHFSRERCRARDAGEVNYTDRSETGTVFKVDLLDRSKSEVKYDRDAYPSCDEDVEVPALKF